MNSPQGILFFDVQGAKRLCLIVGIVCLSGFILGVLALGFPLNLFSIEWRIDFLQQLSDRSITLLFGAALTIWGLSRNRKLLKRAAFLCIVGGVLIHLCSILVIHDSLEFQDMAVANIELQAARLQTQIEAVRKNPEMLGEKATPELIDRTSQNVAGQVKSLKDNARAQITKFGVTSIGNLALVGSGLIAVGRWGFSGLRSE